jgi:hypothetical protein
MASVLCSAASTMVFAVELFGVQATRGTVPQLISSENVDILVILDNTKRMQVVTPPTQVVPTQM